MRKTSVQKTHTLISISDTTSAGNGKSSGATVRTSRRGHGNFRRIITNHQSTITRYAAWSLLIIMVCIILFFCINDPPVGVDLLTNGIVELAGLSATYLLFDMFVNQIRKRNQQMPGKYLHYMKLLKHTKAFIDETNVVKKQLTIGNLSRSETSCWENAREQFEAAVYNTAPYFTQREFDVVWLIICDENLDTDETIMALQEFKEMLEQDIKSNLRGHDTEV